MVLTATSNTITRKELTEAVFKSVPALPRRDSSKILDEFFEEIIEALQRNEQVKLRGFGVFKVQHKNERVGRNPKTGIDAVISPRRAVKFAPAPYVKARANGETPIKPADEDEA